MIIRLWRPTGRQIENGAPQKAPSYQLRAKIRLMMRTFLAILVTLISSQVLAEIEKNAVTCEDRICFHWWPKLPALEGWHQDLKHSYHLSANMQVPDGFTFANAEAVIYAKALYKPRIPETTSIEMLINDDKAEFLARDSAIQIEAVSALTTGDGISLISYTFFPEVSGNWEQVSYGEEGDFYLIFTVSSRSEAGFHASRAVYEKFIRAYRESP